MTTPTVTPETDMRDTAASTAAETTAGEATAAAEGCAESTTEAVDVAEQSPLTAYEKAQLWLLGALREQYEDERGMSTIEYALGCVAAAALGALLYTVVTSDTVENALSGIFERALNE